MIKKSAFFLFSIFFCLLIFSYIGTVVQAEGVPFTSAFTTLTNSRFSYRAEINSAGVGNSANYVTIKTASLNDANTTDINTGNIFPGDIVCFNGSAGYTGCKNSQPVGTTYTVQGVDSPTGTTLSFSPVLAGTLVQNDRIIATQSGQMTVTFKPSTNLLALDKLVLTIAAASSNSTDGSPDISGFDSAALPSDLLAGTGCTANACLSSVGVGLSAASLSSAGSLHTVTVTLNAPIYNTTTYTLTLGHVTNAALRFLNPAPAASTHTRGVSDSYSIRLRSQNTAQAVTYDDTTMKVNPVDGVLVSATVELALSYTIGSIGTSTTVPSCVGASFTTTAASTATTVPFGSIANPDGQFYNIAQTHTITTNATNGYVLTVNYNYPLNLGIGITVPGVTIPDTTCGAVACTTSVPKAWTDYAGYNGFGYTVGNISGSDRASDFTTDGLYKPFSTSAVTVATKSSQASASQVATCYRLAVDATQQTGYYSDKLTYVATPKF